MTCNNAGTPDGTRTSTYAVSVPIEHRQQLIAALAAANGKVLVSELAVQFGVTEMTIRRDLDKMVAAGTILRIHGGAVPATSGSTEPPFAERALTAHAAKAAIGAAAAAMVHPREKTVIIDVGTTALEVARALRLAGTRGLTVVTASVPVAVELGNYEGIKTFLTGGELRHGELSLTGPPAMQGYAGYHCDLAFIGIAGIDPTEGLTEYNPEDAWVKSAAITNARRTIVVADSTKLKTVSFARVAPLSDVDVLVTDLDADKAAIAELMAAGIEVVQAPFADTGTDG